MSPLLKEIKFLGNQSHEGTEGQKAFHHDRKTNGQTSTFHPFNVPSCKTNINESFHHDGIDRRMDNNIGFFIMTEKS